MHDLETAHKALQAAISGVAAMDLRRTSGLEDWLRVRTADYRHHAQ